MDLGARKLEEPRIVDGDVAELAESHGDVEGFGGQSDGDNSENSRNNHWFHGVLLLRCSELMEKQALPLCVDAHALERS